MNSRLRKEFHPLLLPLAVAVGGAGFVTALHQLPVMGEFGTFLIDVAWYVFLGGLTLASAIAFGTEFQHRTLPLLLAQPLGRARLWREKMWALSFATIAAGLVGGLLLMCAARGHDTKSLFKTEEVALAAVFVLATICSCGFWTLLAGSTIGGMAFTAGAQFILAMAVALGSARLEGHEQPFDDTRTFKALVLAGLVYSGVLLWLGRRRFLRVELANTRFGDGSASWGVIGWRSRWSGFLISRPAERTLNLVRKEVCLQKTVFQITAVFVACWLAALLVQSLRPRQNITFIFDILTCLYSPLCSLLAGCISLGEEKLMGLIGSQLTLPCSPRFQWFIKLAVSAATAAAVSLGIPLVLFWLTGNFLDLTGSGLMGAQDHGILGLACVSGLAFLFGFWAISLTATTVRAALMAVIGLATLCAVVALGIWLGGRTRGLQTWPLISVMCQLQLPPEYLRERVLQLYPILGYGMAGLIVLVMLWQSVAQFRRFEARPRTLLAYSLALVGLVAALSAWAVDSASSLSEWANSRPIREFRSAMRSIVLSHPRPAKLEERVVAPEDLQGRRLSKLTQTWLRDAKISYTATDRHFSNGKTETIYQVSVVFPNGRIFYLTF